MVALPTTASVVALRISMVNVHSFTPTPIYFTDHSGEPDIASHDPAVPLVRLPSVTVARHS